MQEEDNDNFGFAGMLLSGLVLGGLWTAFEAAQNTVTNYFKTDESKAKELFDQAQLFFKNADYNSALGCCTQSIMKYPKLPYAYNLAAWILVIHNHNLDEAEEYSRKSLEFEDTTENKANYLDTLGEIYFRKNKFKDAVYPFSQSIAYYRELKNPSLFDTLIRLGETYYFINDKIRALEIFSELTKFLPFASHAYLWLGHLSLEEGAWRESFQHYIKALQLFNEGEGKYWFERIPNTPESIDLNKKINKLKAYYGMATLLSREGSYKASDIIIKKIFELKVDMYIYVDIFLVRAFNAFKQQGDTSTTKRYLNEFIDRIESDKTLIYNYLSVIFLKDELCDVSFKSYILPIFLKKNLISNEIYHRENERIRPSKNKADNAHYQEMIANDQIDEALKDLMQSRMEKGKAFQDTLIGIKARFEHLKKSTNMGVLSFEEANMEIIKIRMAMLNLINDH